MTVIAYTYHGFYDVDGWKLLKSPYLSRHVFPEDKPQYVHQNARVAVFESTVAGARYEIAPDGREVQVADEHSPLIENGKPILVGTGFRISVWVPKRVADDKPQARVGTRSEGSA